MSKKIIVVGANQTGLAFAYLASKRGFEVTVYEAKEKSEVSIWLRISLLLSFFHAFYAFLSMVAMLAASLASTSFLVITL